MTPSRERAIEILVVGLAAAMLYSAPLRDLFAAVLVAVLLWDRFASTDDSGDRIVDAAVVAFLAVTVASTLLSRWPEESLLDLRFYPYGLLLFFGARRIAARGRAATLALATFGLIAVLALDVFAQVVTGASVLTGRTPVWGRYTGSFPFPSDVALLPILFPLTAGVMAGGAWTKVRGALFVATSAAVVASGTRSALLALFFVAGLEALGRHRPRAIGTIAGLIGGFVLAATLAPGPAERLFGLGGGTQHRFAQWQVSLVLAREAPVLGHGPHSFRRLAVERVRAKDPAFSRINLDFAPYPHSVYLETLVGSGVLGLVALLALLALPFRPGAGEDSTLAAARVAVAAFALIAVFDLSLEKDWVELALWLPLGLAVGAAERVRVSVSAASESRGR